MTLNNCIIKNVSTGLRCSLDCSVTIENCIFLNCVTAIECVNLDDALCKITFVQSKIVNSKLYGIVIQNEDSLLESKLLFDKIEDITT